VSLSLLPEMCQPLNRKALPPSFFRKKIELKKEGGVLLPFSFRTVNRGKKRTVIREEKKKRGRGLYGKGDRTVVLGEKKGGTSSFPSERIRERRLRRKRSTILSPLLRKGGVQQAFDTPEKKERNPLSLLTPYGGGKKTKKKKKKKHPGTNLSQKKKRIFPSSGAE